MGKTYRRNPYEEGQRRGKKKRHANNKKTHGMKSVDHVEERRQAKYNRLDEWSNSDVD